MIIDYVSDLHLEINNHVYVSKRNDGRGDVLILAGDIVTFAAIDPAKTDPNNRSIRRRFLKMLQTDWSEYEKIYWIPGNHEYYGYYFDGADEAGKRFCNTLDPRLHLLNNETVELDDNNVIIASTLWTDFRNNPIDMETARTVMNDYAEVCMNEKEYRKSKSPFSKKMKLTPQRTAEVHKESLKFMKSECEKYREKRTIMVSHHAISDRSLNPKFSDNTYLNSSYYTSLDDWISDSRAQVWIHGHTHHDVNYEIGSTRVLGRMHGYVYFERTKEDPLTIGRIEV